jgi:hypothetical protein
MALESRRRGEGFASSRRLAEAVAVVRLGEVEKRSERHDARRIDGRVAPIIMGLDLIEAHGLADAGQLVELAPEVREIVSGPEAPAAAKAAFIILTMSDDSLLRITARSLSHNTGVVTPPGVGGIGFEIDLVEARRAVDTVGCRAGKARAEHPAFFAHDGMDGVETDGVPKPLQLAHDQSAVRPGTGIGDIEMIAARGGPSADF